jgi:hypothetical protein
MSKYEIHPEVLKELSAALMVVGEEILNGYGVGSYEANIEAIEIVKSIRRGSGNSAAISSALALEIHNFMELMVFRDRPSGRQEWEAHSYLIEILRDLFSEEPVARAWTSTPRRASG